MPTRGSSPWIGEAIESIVAQTFEGWRLVISENSAGSPECAAALAPYLEDPRITHQVTGRDLGMAGNLNGLIRLGTAPYIALLHDDDLWHPEFLARRVDFLDAHEDCGLVFGNYLTIDGEGRTLEVSPRRFEAGVHAPADVVPVYIEHTPIGVTSVLVRRSAYEAVGAEFVDGLAWTDHEMWFRIAARFPIGFLDVADSAWRRHGEQTTQKVRLWGEHMARLHESFEATLDALPGLAVDRTLLRRKHGHAALQAALDVLERPDPARSRAYLETALAQDPALRRDPRAVLLRAALPLGRPAARTLVAVRHASWRLNRRLRRSEGPRR
jgi:glycosyltransferase involved in cell wall biosynthesis